MARDASPRLTRAAGRRFALTLASAFAVLALLARIRGRENIAAGAWILSALFLIAALTVPGQLGPVERAWSRLGASMSKITSPVFLGVMYFVVFTPAGFIRRVVGGNAMKHELKDSSYWKVREPSTPEDRKRAMERQF